jgi:hypothetical protein
MTATFTELESVIAAEEQASEIEQPETATAEGILERLADPPDVHVHDEKLLAPLESDLQLAADLIPIRALRGVPLYYERAGAPKPYAFSVARGFVPRLERIVDDVRLRVPRSYGALTRITSAGMYVGKAGMHGKGRACDLDRFTFEHIVIAPHDGDHAAGELARRRRYWSLAAICRSHCCYTLHGEYNAAHRDHLHCDDLVDEGFNTSFSTITLLQALLNTVHGVSPALRVDGVYGPKTRAATAAAIARVGLSGDVHDRAVWLGLLRRSARLGFTLAP